MTKVDNFFEAAAYRGAVPANNDWKAGSTFVSGSKFNLLLNLNPPL
jgi:hypothetical protein